MRKSSSLHVYPLDFNPKQFRTGTSRIDTLPLRRNSASQIPQIQTQQQIDTLKKNNASLLKENEQLRRELQGYKQQYNIGTVLRTEQKVRQYKDKIKEKMSSRTKQSRITQCQTGLLSSKEVSMEPSSLSISDYYDHYRLSQKVPLIGDIQDLAEKFFKDYCDHFVKLKTLFECLQERTSPTFRGLEDQLNLYKLPLLYQKIPQTLLREVSKSKEKLATKGREESKSRKEDSRTKKEDSKSKKEKDICWEVLSPKETISWTEALLTKVIKSESLIKSLKCSEIVRIFTNKIRERS